MTMEKEKHKIYKNPHKWYKQLSWTEKSILWFVFVLVIIVVCSISLSVCLSLEDILFGESSITKHGDYWKLVGAIIGGTVVIWGLIVNNERVKQQSVQNHIAEQGQIASRFKDAALLLADQNSTANLSGVYALHQIAKEMYFKGDRNGYVKTVLDIFCSFLKNHYPIKKLDPEDLYGKKEKLEKESIIRESIIDKLFIGKESIVYKHLHKELSLINLSSYNFNDAYLENSNLSNSVFENTTFVGANFKGASLNECKFYNSDLSKVNFSEADLTSAVFVSCNISNAKIDGSTLINVIFKDCSLISSTLTESNLFNAVITGSDLNYTNLSSADLLGTTIATTSFSWANFSQTKIQGAILDGCNLCGVNFHNSSIINSSFMLSNLSEANFRNAKMDKVNLNQAKLSKSVHLSDDFKDYLVIFTIDHGNTPVKALLNNEEYHKDNELVTTDYFKYFNKDLDETYLIANIFNGAILEIDGKKYKLIPSEDSL